MHKNELPASQAPYKLDSGEGLRYAFGNHLATRIARSNELGQPAAGTILAGAKGARFPVHSQLSVLGQCRIQLLVIGGEGHREADGVVAAWFDQYRCIAAIVRPDHYVYCTVPELGSADRISSTLQNSIGLASIAITR